MKARQLELSQGDKFCPTQTSLKEPAPVDSPSHFRDGAWPGLARLFKGDTLWHHAALA